MDMLPKVKVSFVISGKEFDLSMLTEELNISPSETRSLEDWPEAVKNNVHILEELQPVYEWCISEKEELCLQIETPIPYIVGYFGKLETLITFDIYVY